MPIRKDRYGFAFSQGYLEDKGKCYLIGPHQTIQDAVDNAKTGDTIVLRPRVYKEKVSIDSDLDAKKLTILGRKSEKCISEETIVDGNGDGSVFTIGSGQKVTICDLTIRNGRADNGGGIFNQGTLTLKDVAVTGNTANYGGGIYNAATGTVKMNGGSITGNSDNGPTDEPPEGEFPECGGGIKNAGTMTLIDVTITGNTADYGGGINNAGTLTLKDVAVTGNTANYGGGIYNVATGTLTLNDVTITGNTANNFGGGIFVEYTGSITFDGTEITVKYNKAGDGSESTWYLGYGLYSHAGEPNMKGGFDPAKQVTDNTHI